jgi:hypothetical protein
VKDDIMELFYRRPSIETRKAMSMAALNIKHSSNGIYDEVINAEEGVKKFTRHEYVKIVNSGNSAILSVMSTFDGKIMIPDQGGWSGFKKMVEFNGLESIPLPTNLGLVEIEVLVNIIEKFKPEALFITSFAGYMAEQNLKDIFKICNEMDVVLVEDASGGIGDGRGKLGNGKHAHVVVASTGSPKIVNIGNGGIISTNNSNRMGSKDVLNSLKADPVTCAGIASEIENAPVILSKTMESCKYLKSEIMEFNKVLHFDKEGLNIAIPNENPKKLGYELRKSIEVHDGGIITVCPNYNRVKVKAVCIEIKNLDTRCMIKDNLDTIIDKLRILC